MAISTYKSFLMHQVSSTYEKLVDVKTDPDMGGEPGMLDVTTLSDGRVMNILDIESGDAAVWTANYDKDDFQKIKALEGVTHKFAQWYGGTVTDGVATPTGSEGKFEFEGQITVFPVGGGVSEPRDMQITIAISSAIVPNFVV